MSKNILIVLEEIIQGIPSGVVSVTENLIQGIYKKNNLSILTNNSHWIIKKNNFKFINKIKEKEDKFLYIFRIKFFFEKNPKNFCKIIFISF